MGGVFQHAESTMEEDDERHDAHVRPAAEWTELLLCVASAIFSFVALASWHGEQGLTSFADYYGDTFFKSAGTTMSSYNIQTILGGVSVIGTIPALYLIETMGRRRVREPGLVLVLMNYVIT